MGFKKAFKKLRKTLHLPAVTLGNAAKLGAAVATGGVGGALGAVTLSKLKSAAVGGIKQVARAKAAKALAKRVIAQHPAPTANPTPVAAQTMPGGAPLKKGSGRRRRRTSQRESESTAIPKAPAPRRRAKAAKPAGAKRQPPKGGKDLKALAAAWRAAGKPGKWIDWVKSH